ncbi:MAG: SRPBCC family protein [Acidimicrobiia bacterium]
MTTHVFLKRVDLPAAPDVVFWDLLEPVNVAEYDSHFRSWVPRERPPRLGTKVDFVAKVFGVWSKGASEFVAFEAPHHLELRLVRPPTPLKSLMTWDLVETDTGTSFEYRLEIHTPVGLGWLGQTLLSQFTSHLESELPALARRFQKLGE